MNPTYIQVMYIQSNLDDPASTCKECPIANSNTLSDSCCDFR